MVYMYIKRTLLNISINFINHLTYTIWNINKKSYWLTLKLSRIFSDSSLSFSISSRNSSSSLWAMSHFCSAVNFKCLEENSTPPVHVSPNNCKHFLLMYVLNTLTLTQLSCYYSVQAKQTIKTYVYYSTRTCGVTWHSNDIKVTFILQIKVSAGQKYYTHYYTCLAHVFHFIPISILTIPSTT